MKRSLYLYMPLLCLIALGLIACEPTSKPKPSQKHHRTSAITATATPYAIKTAVPSLSLSSGSVPVAESSAQPELAATVPLDDSASQAILKRLPALPKDDISQDFQMRAQTRPVPRTGNTIQVPFPSPEDEATPQAPESTANEQGELQVLRYSPDEQSGAFSRVSITFSHPMVALDSQSALSQNTPVTLTPAVKGQWRWLGTKTLVFEPKDHHLPMATAYTVTIPAGIKSASGLSLAKEVSFHFKTTPLRFRYLHPQGGSVPLDTLILLEFNQDIEAEKVFPYITVKSKHHTYPCALALDAEVRGDAKLSALLENTPAKRYIVLKPKQPLPGASHIEVTLQRGAPSAEGALLSEDYQTKTFDTYGPFSIIHRDFFSLANWEKYSPGQSWNIDFTNPIDDTSFDPLNDIKVVPELEDMSVSCNGYRITISGNSQGNVTYEVTCSEDMRDEFGQHLSGNMTSKFRVGKAGSAFRQVGGNMVVLDPNGPLTYSLYTINKRYLKVKLYKVTPADYPQYERWREEARDWQIVNGKEKPTQLPPGELVFDKIVTNDVPANVFTETRFDLSPALDNGIGHAVLQINSTNVLKEAPIIVWIQSTNIGLSTYADSREMLAWATDLRNGQPLQGVSINGYPGNAQGLVRLKASPVHPKTLVAKLGADSAFLTELEDLFPKRSLDKLKWHVFSDRGIYKPKEKANFKGFLRIMTSGPQGDIIPAVPALRSVTWMASDSQGNELGHGESELSPFGGFDLALDIPDNVNLGTASINFKANISSTSKADIKKAKKELLSEYLEANRDGSVSFEIQEFRRPEFEVNASNGQSTCFLGEPAQVNAEAKYYAGGALSGASINWSVKSTPSHYSPPGWDEFQFGERRPFWLYFSNDDKEPSEATQDLSAKTDANGKHTLDLTLLSSNEADRLPLPPTSITATAVVGDLNSQTISTSTNLLVHPSERYVGLKSAKPFIQLGQPLHLEAIVTDLDGKVQSQVPIDVHAAAIIDEYHNGKLVERENDVHDFQIKSSDAPITTAFTPTQSGLYRITAEVRDGKQRRNFSRLTICVGGGHEIVDRTLNSDRVELIADKDEYRAGDIAEVMVVAPFSPAEGIYTLDRNGAIESKRFTMEGGTFTIKIPIKEEYVPNLNLNVNLVGNKEREDLGEDESSPSLLGIPLTPMQDKATSTPQAETPTAAPTPTPSASPSAAAKPSSLGKRPAYASGSLTLKVPPYQRTLNLQIVPQKTKLAPGAEASVTVTLKDAQDRPVADSEIALVAVDEAVLALLNYSIPNPLDVFYTHRYDELLSHDLRSFIQLSERPERMNAPKAKSLFGIDQTLGYESVNEDTMDMAINSIATAPAKGMSAEMAAPAAEETRSRSVQASTAAPNTPINLRSDFNPQAMWMASVHTDSQGQAQASFKLPGNLTRYRLTAVAVNRTNSFGIAENSLTACLPLMVRPTLPRFLNFGDSITLPVVVQNQSEEDMQVDLALRAQNLTLQGPQGRRLSVPANSRRLVQFPAQTQKAGQARVQVAAASGNYADGTEITIPIYTPCTTEAFATYGQIDKGAIKQPVHYPQGVWPQFGGLEVTTSSTAVQELTDAYLALHECTYDSSEYLASQLLSTLALKDVLSAFQAPGLLRGNELKAHQKVLAALLVKRQKYDGSFRSWDDSESTYPFCSLHVTNALMHIREVGLYVDDSDLERAVEHGLEYAKKIDRHLKHEKYSEKSKLQIQAYALNILEQAGQGDSARACELLSKVKLEDAPIDAIGWIIPTLAKGAAHDDKCQTLLSDIWQMLRHRVSETADAANFSDSYGIDSYLVFASNNRTDGIMLDALITAKPDSDLIPKLVRGLLKKRRRGAWRNTQENVFILMALNRYFQTYEKVTPDFVAHLWLGQDYAGHHDFHGRSTDYKQSDIPMSWLARHPMSDLTLSKEGEGRLYYRLGLKYAPRNLMLKPFDCGFEVTRTYEAIDNPDDVKQMSDGSYQVKLGSLIRCRTVMAIDQTRYNVALVNPLPAGFEALNPELATDAAELDTKRDKTLSRYSGYGSAFSHINLRDERAEAFTDYAHPDTYEFNFIARATTKGIYVAPPAKAEEMYSPEVFGRSGSTKIIIK